MIRKNYLFVCLVVLVVLVLVMVLIVDVVDLILSTTTFTAQHILNYGTSGDGGSSDIGWVVMLVVVIVRY